MKTNAPYIKPEPTPKSVGEEIIYQLALASCHVSALNSRHPNPADVSELALSIKTHGQTTPAIVRPHPKKKGEYEIGAGARRRVACEVAGVATLGCVIRLLEDTAFEELILVENLQREDPDPRAEIELIDRLVKRGIHTAEQISAHLGKPNHWAERRLQLLKVIPEARKLWGSNGESGLIHFSVEMMSLVGALPADTQRSLIARENWNFRRCDSYKSLKKYLDGEIFCRLDQAPFDLKDKRFFVRGCGPGCACDSSMLSSLFEDGKKEAPRCLNTQCFMQRLSLAQKAKYDEVAAGASLPVIKTDHNAASSLRIGDKVERVQHVYDWEHTVSEKPTKTGKKAVLIETTGKMKLVYVTPKASGSGAAKKVQSPAVRMTERKSILQGKRLLLVHGELKKALADAKHTACTEDLIDLVAVFGLPYEAHDWYGDETWKQFDARKKSGFPLQAESRGYVPEYSRRTPKAKGVDKSRAAALWHGLQVVLDKVMDPPRRVGDVPKRENSMRRVAKLITFPFDAKKKEADLKILPPRTWGHVDPHTLEPCKSPTLKGLQASVDKAVAKIKKRAKVRAKKASKK